MKAHVSLTETRALLKPMKSRKSNTINRSILTPGTKIYIFHKRSCHADPVPWQEANVFTTEGHIVRCRRSATGRDIIAAYEDICLKPDDELAQKLLFKSLDGEVHDERELVVAEDTEAPSDGASYLTADTNIEFQQDQAETVEGERILQRFIRPQISDQVNKE